MKKLLRVLLIMAMVISVASCGSKESSSDETTEPKTEAEFQASLDELGISMYEGSEVTGIKTGSNSELYTHVPAEKGDLKAVMEHYTKEVENALSGKDEWVSQLKSNRSIMFRKGFTGWVFGVSAVKDNDKNGLKVTLTYGDNAVSYDK